MRTTANVGGQLYGWCVLQTGRGFSLIFPSLSSGESSTRQVAFAALLNYLIHF